MRSVAALMRGGHLPQPSRHDGLVGWAPAGSPSPIGGNVGTAGAQYAGSSCLINIKRKRFYPT